MHFSLQLALRDAAKHQIALLDFSWLDFLIAPPSGFILVLAKVDGRLYLDGFDVVYGWLHDFKQLLWVLNPA